ncbi:peptidoglycan-binding domain-containing protein [Ruania rhizosphaerae]|uniref:peptidoglycan-binding domain-containing protein n=1 Tax=Ruania rhizosphaerae TaxID=1840413 RepID=UPI00135C3679|nr:peptidoglycan-binding domain-containing protein [Ruania rhizosphaerae]
MVTLKKGRLPGAVWDPISKRSLLSNRPVRMTVHMAVTDADDIYGPGKGPGRTYAHAYNPLDEAMRQHQEIHRKAYADLDGNGKTFAVEHQGRPGDRMSGNQIDNDARAFAHLVTEHGVPNRIASYNDTTGLAWHRLGCKGNFGAFDKANRKTWSGYQTGQRWSTVFGKTCPTDAFIDQLDEIFDLAQDYIEGVPVKRPPKQKPAPVTGSGKKTPRKSRKYAKLRRDGDFGPVTATAYQILLDAPEVDYYHGDIDGDFGSLSIRAEQEWLRDLGFYKGRIDGIRGPMTRKALQSFLRSKGLYSGRIDGWLGPMSVKALQSYLNQQRKYL